MAQKKTGFPDNKKKATPNVNVITCHRVCPFLNGSPPWFLLHCCVGSYIDLAAGEKPFAGLTGLQLKFFSFAQVYLQSKRAPSKVFSNIIAKEGGHKDITDLSNVYSWIDAVSNIHDNVCAKNL